MADPVTPPETPKVAVALRYEGDLAPKVVASGKGEVAQMIVEAAQKHGIPLREDPALASLLAQVELGGYIPPGLYRAVAEVLAFALRLRQEAGEDISQKLPERWQSG